MRESSASRIGRALGAALMGAIAVSMASCASGEPGWVKDDARFSGPAWKDPAPHRRGRVNVNNTAVAYLDWSPRGTPVILVHDMGDNAHAFDDLAALLSPKFRVIAYSRRGHGESEESWEGY